MKIERWGVYWDNCDTINTFCHLYMAQEEVKKNGGRLVLITGELPEPKKVRMAPAFCKGTRNHISQRYYRTAEMFDNEEDARANCKDAFICWPAPVPDSDGYITVEVNG